MDALPVDCIGHILAFTSPKDVCRLAGVSSTFKSAADSNLLWKTFLPADYRKVIAQSASSSMSSFLNSSPEKALYFHLSDHPLLVNKGNSSLSLEKQSGKKCYMMGIKRKYCMIEAKELDTMMSMMRTNPRPRFPRVARAGSGCSFQMKGKIDTKNLTPKTNYAAYFVFKFMTEDPSLISFKSLLSSLYFKGAKMEEQTMVPFQGFSVERADGWMEIDIGQIFVEGNCDTIILSLFNNRALGSDLIIQGIEIRPISKMKLKPKSLWEEFMPQLFSLSCIPTPLLI